MRRVDAPGTLQASSAVDASVFTIATTRAEPDETRLVIAAQAGDRNSYAQLLERHQAAGSRRRV
ncbi:MAG: hypothetical protein ACRDNK_00425 [Solirubrobacteraceae bacterium]